MNIPDIDTITTAEQGRDLAIEWSYGAAAENYSWGEFAEWGSFFASVADKFPELLDEFRENAII